MERSNEKREKNFCIVPFTGMVIRADSSYSVCCYNSENASNEEGTTAHIYEQGLESAFHSPFYQELRRSMLADERHPSCAKCWQDDDSGLMSKRKFENIIQADLVKKVLKGEEITAPSLISMNLGNLCNLKCRICGPVSSSRWAQEYLELYGVDHIPRESRKMKTLSLEESRSLLTNWPSTTPGFVETLRKWWPSFRRVEFLGGESLLNKVQIQLLKDGAPAPVAEHQQIDFTTNGSLFPDNDLIESWKKYKSVSVNISIDGLDRHFEYQRFGARWEDVAKNIQRYRNLGFLSRVNVLLTVSIFNIFYLPEIYAGLGKLGFPVNDVREWSPASGTGFVYRTLRERVRKFLSGGRPEGAIFTSFVFNPEKFDVRGLPLELKNKIAVKFQAAMPKMSESARVQLDVVLDHLFSEDFPNLWPKALENIWFHDKYRKQSFAETFPEFYQIARDQGQWLDFNPEKSG